MYKTGGDPSTIIKEKNLAQVSNEKELEEMVDKSDFRKPTFGRGL